MRLVFVAVGLTACAQNAVPEPEAATYPTRIVTPLCSDALWPVVLEFRAIRDPQPHKPSKDVRHYLVDLRIVRRDREDLWLLVDEDTFPSAVESVHATDDPTTVLRPQHPLETWWFVGNDIVRAWPLGSAPESSFRNVDVGTGAARVPVSLGRIDVAGMPARQWVRQAGADERRHAADRVTAAFEPYCTTWFDLEAEAQHGERSIQ